MAGGAIVTGTADVGRVEAPVTFKAYMICAFAAFGGIFFGYDTGWMSGVLAMPYYISLYTGIPYDYNTGLPIGVNKDDFVLPSSTQSLFTSILSCGTFFGALVGGDIADFIGRRPTIIAGCFVFSVGCILQISSSNQEVLFVFGRLIAGGGVGFISAVVILYMSEIAPKKVRGAMVSGYQFCITIGILLANCVVYATQNRSDSGSYRIPIGIQFLWAIILGAGLFYLPESPRYFVKKGKIEDAAKALAFVRGQPLDSDFIKDELAEIVANNEFELQHIPQTSFKQLGTVSNPFLISLVTTLVNVLSTPISFYTIERFGRRKLLLTGATGMIISQFIVGAIGVTQGRQEVHNDAAVQAMIAFICINIAFFATTWGPTAWVVVGEVFPLPIRSRGVGISTASNWFWNTIIAVITPYLVNVDEANLGPKVFFLWGSLCCLSLTFAYFLVPELKGLSLEQADMCMQEVSPRRSAGWKPSHTYAAEMHHVDDSAAILGDTVEEKV
ncbi:hypothetical protein ABKA04_010039 [Annulohypoxylon sp. FPYF3050]